MKKNGCKNGLKSGHRLPELTPIEKEVLNMVAIEYLTAKQVSIRRQCSTQMVYKIVRSLRKKGALTSTNKMVANFLSTMQPKNQIRLHGQEFNIKIIYKDHRYKDKIKKSNQIHIDGNTIRLYKNSLEVYGGQSFFGDDVQKATAKSIQYWDKLFTRLENDLKILIVKNRAQNIKVVNQHYAEINNGLATDCEMKGDKIKIYTTEEGKLWFLIDNSFNLHEAETVHPETSKQDMQDSIRPFFNDLRDNKPPTMSELMCAIKQVIDINKETAAGLNAVVQAMKPQQPTPSLQPKTPIDYLG